MKRGGDNGASQPNTPAGFGFEDQGKEEAVKDYDSNPFTPPAARRANNKAPAAAATPQFNPFASTEQPASSSSSSKPASTLRTGAAAASFNPFAASGSAAKGSKPSSTTTTASTKSPATEAEEGDDLYGPDSPESTSSSPDPHKIDFGVDLELLEQLPKRLV